MTSVVFEESLGTKSFGNSATCSRRTRVARRDETRPMRTPLFRSILIASACAMFGCVAMPANAQPTVTAAGTATAAGSSDTYLLWLWVSILIIAPAVGAVCAGIALAFGKRAI